MKVMPNGLEDTAPHTMAERWSRREFLSGMLAGAGIMALGEGGLAATRWALGTAGAAEPPPETTKLRLDRRPSLCVAPQYVAEEFLRAEGFADIQYIKKGGPKEIEPALASGEIDIAMHFAAPLLIRVDVGDRVLVLSGGHVGCFELFGTDKIRAVRDLKGKSVAVSELGGPSHVFVSSMVAYVGLDPRKDINWVTYPQVEAKRLLAEGKVDAFLGFPPDPQELRAKKIGHVVVSSMMDKPWSQYFCCMVVANREFVRKNPVATKRALRAILKAADVAGRDPVRAARFLADKGYTQNYDYALQLMKDLPYGQWREYDPEDTLRFYALRLREAGMIKSTPQKLITQGTDWRFLNEIKREWKRSQRPPGRAPGHLPLGHGG